MPEIKLKPCPFCGGKAQIRVIKRIVNNTACELEYRAECTNPMCGIEPRTYGYRSRLFASVNWNRRADDGKA